MSQKQVGQLSLADALVVQRGVGNGRLERLGEEVSV